MSTGTATCMEKRIDAFVYSEEGPQADATGMVGQYTDGLKEGLKLLLKEQDRLTKIACSLSACKDFDSEGKILMGSVHSRIINCQGGLK